METRATSFGEFLQRKREESRMTLRKLADSLGFSAPFLSDVEKGRRNPPDLAKLEQIAEILSLSTEDKQTMFDLAGEKRESVAPDLPEYIMSRRYVSAALRTARDLEASEEDWQRFIRELQERDEREKNRR